MKKGFWKSDMKFDTTHSFHVFEVPEMAPVELVDVLMNTSRHHIRGTAINGQCFTCKVSLGPQILVQYHDESRNPFAGNCSGADRGLA